MFGATNFFIPEVGSISILFLVFKYFESVNILKTISDQVSVKLCVTLSLWFFTNSWLTKLNTNPWAPLPISCRLDIVCTRNAFLEKSIAELLSLKEGVLILRCKYS